MKSLPRASKAFTLIELLVVIAIIAILAALAVPQITSALVRGQLTQTVSNAKQIYLATFQMAADYAVTADTNLGWPGDLAVSKDNPIQDLPSYVQRMIDYDYLKKGDVGKIFSASGIRAYSGTGTFSSENSAFKMYKVKENDVSQVLFLATKNFTFGKGLDATASPYGDKGFVIFRKGGDGLNMGRQQALNKNLIGFMPGSTSQDDPGQESNNVLN